MTTAVLPLAGADIGDILPGAITADHDGWFLMDGRAKAVLPAVAQAGLTALGWTVIPDMSGNSIRDVGAVNSTGGGETTTLVKANLPSAIIPGGTLAQVDNPHAHALNNGNDIRRNKPTQHTGTARNGPANLGPIIDVTVATGGAHAHTFNLPLGGAGAAIPTENDYLSVRWFIFLGA